jgi:hypothetical protein
MGSDQHNHHKKGEPYNKLFVKNVVGNSKKDISRNEKAPTQKLE